MRLNAKLQKKFLKDYLRSKIRYRQNNRLNNTFLPKLLPNDADGYVQSLLEDLMCLFTTLIRTRDILTILPCVVSFIKHRCPNFSETVFDFLRDLVYEMPSLVSLQSKEVAEIESDILQKLSIEDRWNNIVQSDIFKHLNRMFIIITCIATLGWDVKLKDISRIEQHSMFVKFQDISSLGHYVISTIKFVFVQLRQFIKSGTWSHLFHSKETYTTWANDCLDVEIKYNKVVNKTERVDKHALIKKTRELIRDGDDILKIMRKQNVPSRDQSQCVRLYTRMLEIDAMLTVKTEAYKTRILPLGIAIVGTTSVGKSTFMKMLYHYFAKIREKEASADNMYVVNPDNDFMDGFETNQWCIVFDDVAIFRPNRIQGIDNTLLLVLRVINKVPTVAHQASLEDKGKNPIDPELVMITSNVSDLNIPIYYSCPLAVARRIPIRIHLEVKDEFRGPMGNLQVDEDKYQKGYCDYWRISVAKPVVVQNTSTREDDFRQDFKYETSHVFESIKEFLPWYAQYINQHFQHEEEVNNNEDILANETICKDCYCPSSHCICNRVTLQSKNEEYYSTMYLYLTAIIFNIIIAYWYSGSIYYTLCATFERMIRYMTVYCVGKIGEHIFRSLGGNSYILLVITALATAFLMFGAYQFYTWYTTPSMQASLSELGYEFKDLKERESIWRKKNYELSQFDLPTSTCSFKNKSREEVIDKLSRGLFLCEFIHGSNKRTSNIVCLNGNTYATTTHTVKSDNTVVANVLCNNRELFISTMLNPTLVQASDEYCQFELLGMMRGKNLKHFIPPDFLHNFSGRGFILTRRAKGKLHVIECSRVYATKTDLPNTPGLHNLYVCEQLSEPTVDGDCGGMLVLETPSGPILAGMHVAFKLHLLSNKGTAYSIPFKNLLNDDVNSGVPNLQSKNSRVGKLGPLNPKSDLTYIKDAHVYVHGSFEGWKAEPRTRFVKSLIHDDLTQEGFSTDFGIPRLKGWEVRHNILAKACTSNNSVDPLIALACKTALVNSWLEVGPVDVSMTSYKDAVNGVPGVRFVDRMNMSSSMGFPFKSQKKRFLVPLTSEGLNGPVVFDKEIEERIQGIFDSYDNNTLVHPVYCLSIKDELRKKHKIEKKEYRGFFGGPADFIVVMRMVYLRFIRVVQLNKDIFETAVGTEAQCIEWQRLYNIILRAHPEGDRCVFGDFSKFDVTMVSQFLYNAFDAIADFIACNSTDDDKVVHYARMIAREFDNITVDAFGDLITLIGKNPSGNALTVLINSIVNSMYMRYVYLINHPQYVDNDYYRMLHILKHFREHVSLLTYGDDNGMSVHKDCYWFDHTVIQNSLARIGVTYTMADKETETTPFINIEDATFLQRSFVYDKDLEVILCPLNKGSIVKSLFYSRTSDFMDMDQLTIQNMENAIREAFFHGKEYFEFMSDLMYKIASKHGLQLRLITWESEAVNYIENSLAFEKSKHHFKQEDVIEWKLQASNVFQCYHCGVEERDQTRYHCQYCYHLLRCFDCDAYIIYRGDVAWCPSCNRYLSRNGDLMVLCEDERGLERCVCRAIVNVDETNYCDSCHIIVTCLACESLLSYLYEDRQIVSAHCNNCGDHYGDTLLHDIMYTFQALESCLDDSPSSSQRTFHSVINAQFYGKIGVDCCCGERCLLMDSPYLREPVSGISQNPCRHMVVTLCG